MADIEVWAVESSGGRVRSLNVRFKGTSERVVTRDEALHWLAQGHSLILYSGSPHHGHRGDAIERVEVDGAAYLRTDTTLVAEDHVPHGGHGHH